MRLRLDPAVRQDRTRRVLLGGDPGRLVRLGPGGPAHLDRLATVGLPDPRADRVAARLLDHGMVHPAPDPVDAAGLVTVVVPVHVSVQGTGPLARCLQALDAGGLPVVVVDDASPDHAALAGVCDRPGVRLVRRSVNAGPGAARDTALEHVGTPFVAFVDSDCLPPADWVPRLLGHFSDPQVVAVAPRVQGASAGDGARDRVSAAGSPLDLGPRPARVRPGGPVAYVPTAALLVRVAALPRPAFDPALRVGEDVDLVWRLHDAGGTVRYDPSVTVRHQEPLAWRAAWDRRRRYGTSAAALAQRHGSRVAPLVARPWPAAAAALLVLGGTRGGRARAAWAGAGAAYLVATTRLARATRPLPPTVAAAVVGEGVVATATRTGRATLTLAPWLLPLLGRRVGGRLALLGLLSHELERRSRGAAVDPVRWAGVRTLDEAAYGVGVWQGVVRTAAADRRALAALWPRGRRPL